MLKDKVILKCVLDCVDNDKSEQLFKIKKNPLIVVSIDF